MSLCLPRQFCKVLYSLLVIMEQLRFANEQVGENAGVITDHGSKMSDCMSGRFVVALFVLRVDRSGYSDRP